jgi:hypothetical protein
LEIQYVGGSSVLRRILPETAGLTQIMCHSKSRLALILVCDGFYHLI